MQKKNKKMQDWLNNLFCSIAQKKRMCTMLVKLYLCCKSWRRKKYFKHLQYVVTCLICLCCIGIINGQTIVKGTVTDRKKGAIENASIDIKGSKDGTMSDSAGNFSFTVNAKGNQTIAISAVGFQPVEKNISIDDSTIVLVIVLNAAEKILDAVTVSAGSFEASDKAKGASLTPMDAMTVAGNGGDISNSLRSLPGPQQIGDKEGLFVRGGTSDETKQFIDGALMPVPNYSSVPGIIQPARINPFLFKGVLFNTGGYSALYGEALSSALILESVDLPDKSSASLHIFPTAQGVGFQKLAKDKKASWGINSNYGNYIFYNSLVKQNYDFFHAPEYFSTDFNFRIKTNNGGMLKFYTNYGYNHTGLRNPDIDSVDLKSSFENKGSNLYANLSYRQPLKNNWRLDAALAYNFSNQTINNHLLDSSDKILYVDYYPFNAKNSQITTKENFAQARIVFAKSFIHNQAFRFGAEHFYNNDAFAYNDTPSKFTDNLTAAFAEGDLYIAKNVAAKIGLRAEHSTLLNKTNLAPRISLAYRLNNGGQFNLAYGVFYQKPDIIYFSQNNILDYTRATHYVINYQRKFNNRLIRIEGYYKQYKNLVTTIPDTATTGDGYAKGIELFFRDKKTFKNFDYWITYTYLDTKRRFLNYPYALQPNFAIPHTASVAIKRFFPDIHFNANLSYSIATGRPYYNIQNADSKIIVANAGKTNMYNQMNLSFAYLFNMFKKWKYKDFSGIGFGINNVFGTKQIYGYNYSYNGLFKTPVTMPATRSYYLGIFMSFGIDRTEDFINDKL